MKHSASTTHRGLGVYQYNGLEGAWRRGRPRWRAHPAVGGAPEALSPWRSVATAPSRPWRSRGARRPAAARPCGRRRTDMQPEIRGPRQRGSESLLLAVEVKPTKLKAPLVAPCRLTPQNLWSTICSAPGPVAPARWGPASCWRGQPTTRSLNAAGNGDTFQLLWPGVELSSSVDVPFKPDATGR